MFFASAQALTIAPARVEISGNPGQTLTGEYLLINEEKTLGTFYSSFENFEAQGETGSPYFVGGNEGLASWIDSPEEIILAPGESKKLLYSITIPTEADPGGHFAAIFWGTTKPGSEGNGQVSVGAKIGVVMLLRVSGDVEEGGGVLSFETLDEQKAEEEGLKTQKLFIMLPVDFNYRFQNDGGDRVKPKGTITIKNMLGMTTEVLDANPQTGNVLPKSIRKFKLSWNGGNGKKVEQQEMPDGFIDTVKYQMSHFALGVYTAHLELTYGAGNELEDYAKVRFFVIPWQLLIIIFIVLVGLFLLLKSYNKMIIKKAQKLNNVSFNNVNNVNNETSVEAQVESENQQSKNE